MRISDLPGGTVGNNDVMAVDEAGGTTRKVGVKYSLTSFSTSIESGLGGTGELKGYYDPRAKTARITGWYRGVTSINTNTAIFIIPSDYRPAATYEGAGMTFSTGNVPSAYTYDVTASGAVRQKLGSTVAGGFFYIEYPVG